MSKIRITGNVFYKDGKVAWGTVCHDELPKDLVKFPVCNEVEIEYKRILYTYKCCNLSKEQRTRIEALSEEQILKILESEDNEFHLLLSAVTFL